ALVYCSALVSSTMPFRSVSMRQYLFVNQSLRIGNEFRLFMEDSSVYKNTEPDHGTYGQGSQPCRSQKPGLLTSAWLGALTVGTVVGFSVLIDAAILHEQSKLIPNSQALVNEEILAHTYRSEGHRGGNECRTINQS